MDPYYTLRNTVSRYSLPSRGIPLRAVTNPATHAQVWGIAGFATFGVLGTLLAGASVLIIHRYMVEWEEQRRLLGWEEPDELDEEAAAEVVAEVVAEAQRVAAETEIQREAFFDSVEFAIGWAYDLIDTPSPF